MSAGVSQHSVPWHTKPDGTVAYNERLQELVRCQPGGEVGVEGEAETTQEKGLLKGRGRGLGRRQGDEEGGRK